MIEKTLQLNERAELQMFKKHEKDEVYGILRIDGKTLVSGWWRTEDMDTAEASVRLLYAKEINGKGN